MPPWSLLIDPISKLLDKIIPDPQAAAQAKLELIKIQNQEVLDEMNTQLSAILAEANSEDKWTSRARPSFLYVVYILILWSIPMGIITVFRPDIANTFTVGFQAWLKAIPDPILDLFKIVMVGYVAGRSWEKVTAIKNK